MIIPTLTSRWKRTGLLFSSHLLNDTFASMFAPLLPLLIVRLDLSLALAGSLGAILIAVNSFSQPTLGHLMDRRTRPMLVLAGPLLTISAMCFIGVAQEFWQLVLILVVAGLGTGLFHPAAAALVHNKGGAKQGFAMAFFSSGGAIGAAVSPLLIVAYVGWIGLEQTPWLFLPAIAMLAWIAVSFRRLLSNDEKRRSNRRVRLPNVRGMFTLLWIVILFRSTTAIAFASFLAVLVTQRGASAFLGGAAISVFSLSGAVGVLVGGWLSDQLGRKLVIFLTIVSTTPILLLFLHGPEPLAFLFLAVGGFLIYSAVPAGVVAAQELLPENIGLVSGLVMGLAAGIGALALTPIGWLADRYGLVPVMTAVAFLPAIASVLILFYRDQSPTSRAKLS